MTACDPPACDSIGSRQRGATLPEAVLSLAIMAVMAVGFGTAVSNSRGDLKLAGAASQLATLRAAGDRYVQDNFATLVASAAGGPVAVPISTLTAQNYLPPSFPTLNAYGQAYQLYVRERSPTVLESLALTTGGTAMSSSDGGRIALLLKASGGFTPAGSATINGTNGGWSAPLATYVPAAAPQPSGTPAAYSIQYAVMGPTGALIRYATGNPVDNQMQTAIAMNGNNINGANNIGAQSISLPSGGTVSMGSSYLYGDNTNTAIRQPGGHYVQDTAGNTRWVVDGAGNTSQLGNVTAASGNFNAYLATNGQMSSNTVYTNGLTVAGQSNLAGGAYLYNVINSGLTVGNGGPGVLQLYGSSVYDTGNYLHLGSSNAYADGNFSTAGNSAANTLQVNGVAGAGGGCGPNGLVAQDGSGRLLSCVNGVWSGSSRGNGAVRNAGGNNFYCDAGFTLVSLHYDCGCTNNATWFECQPV
jgi:type II secretory pathway pseudopilin PulG